MFWLLESWRWNCSPSRATRVWEITEKELYTSEYFNLKIKCTGTFKLTFVPMNGAWFSLKWRAHASTKKGNAENGRSILLTIPTKRCLASYSSSAESKRLRIRAMLGYPDSGYMIPESCSRRLKEMGSRKNGHGAREGNTPLPLPSCVSHARLFLSCAVTSKHLLHRLSYL